MTTKHWIGRALAKAIHLHGEPTADGRLVVSPDELVTALLALDVFSQPKAKTDDETAEADDAEGQAELEEYDPTAEGKAMAKRQIGEQNRRRDAFR